MVVTISRRVGRGKDSVIMVVPEGRQKASLVCWEKEGRRWLEMVRGCGRGC
jgi:RIO-like serine/threonine protein kinase